MDISQYLTLAQAAQLLGYTDGSALRRYCQLDRIPGAYKIGKTWLVPTTWAEEEQKNPSLAPQGGRGKGRKSPA